MNKADSDRIQELCSRIAVETDRHEFLKLVEELNRLLSAQELPPKTDGSEEED
jgi:hypothetical protein